MTDEELAAELIQRAEAIEMTAGPEMSDVKRFRLAAARLRGLVTTATRDAERLRLLEAVEAAADRFAFCGCQTCIDFAGVSDCRFYYPMVSALVDARRALGRTE